MLLKRFDKAFEAIPKEFKHEAFNKWYRRFSMGIDRTYQATTRLLNIEIANLAKISPENSYDDMIFNTFAAKELNVLPFLMRIGLLKAGENILYFEDNNGTEARIDTDLTMCESSILEYNRLFELT